MFCSIRRAASAAQVSFVNGVATRGGGAHVTAVTDQVVRAVVAAAAKKRDGAAVKPATVRACLFVFVNCKIDNPAFSSQTKDVLTTAPAAFGSRCVLSDAFLRKAVALVLDTVLDITAARASLTVERSLKKTDGSKTARVTGLPKLTDATWAGTARSGRCTLILTEGDSAKSLAVAGLSVVGRDAYGVFPLRGKLLNCLEASPAAIAANAEVTALKKILGLRPGAGVGNLRYGHVMLMTDADVDGSHITGLVLNFFNACFPDLLRVPGFLQAFVTPVVRATSRGGTTLSFYNLEDYEEWRAATPGAQGWTVKYYKGLGTSTREEAKEYFSDLPRHVKTYVWTDPAADALDKAFNKGRVADRRTWISGYDGARLDPAATEVPVVDFVDKELVLFSRADLERSIPSAIDGLKASQRKVLFAAFKRGMTSDIKVAQFGGYAAEHSAYHHGEASMTATIVSMAQDFVGSNNVNLLVPSGQFGTRLMGGKDAASARYIFTRLAPVARALFPAADDAVLERLVDDGQDIEPRFYVPVVPVVLLNGAAGIGTGWSTAVPMYEPAAVIANVRRMIGGLPPSPMTPWYRGFRGTVTPVPGSPGVFSTEGVFVVDPPTKPPSTGVTITELPIGTWTQDAKEHLDALLDKGAIRGYRDRSDDSVRFEVDLGADSEMDIPSTFKLRTLVRTTNMHLFVPSEGVGGIRRYGSPEEILEEHFAVRREAYSRRKAHVLSELREAEKTARNRARFARDVASGKVLVGGRSKAEIEADMAAGGYDAASDGFGYLLGMAIHSLTAERSRDLDERAAGLARDIADLEAKTPEAMWLADLDELESALASPVGDRSAKKRRVN